VFEVAVQAYTVAVFASILIVIVIALFRVVVLLIF
jgi:hypothetical protein